VVAGNPLLASASPVRRLPAGVIALVAFMLDRAEESVPSVGGTRELRQSAQRPMPCERLLSDGRTDPWHVND
jgi:hypothetical protein